MIIRRKVCKEVSPGRSFMLNGELASYGLWWLEIVDEMLRRLWEVLLEE